MSNQNNISLSAAKHIAIIMDGNRRWAKSKGLKAIDGHKKGITVVEEVIKLAIDFRIDNLTLFAFSSENWRRKDNEIQDLIGLLRFFLNKQIDNLLKEGICLKVLGDISLFPKDISKQLIKLEEKSSKNTKLTLVIAMNYGARQEITYSIKKIANDLLNKNISVPDITEEKISSYLYTSGLPDPDLIIRTGGDCRLSNFLLWQAAYSELIFIKKPWPEFSKNDFKAAINEFNKRERRFGGF